MLRRSGYEATTMKDIAAEVKLTAASLYHHFQNKDALLLAVLEAGLEYVIRQIEPIVHSNMASGDKLRQMIGAHIVSLTGNTAVGTAMVFEIRSLMNVRSSSEDWEFFEVYIARRDAFFARRDYYEDLFRCVVRDGIQQHAFRSVDVGIFTKSLLGANNWVGVWYREDGRLSGPEIADMLADTFLRALKS